MDCFTEGITTTSHKYIPTLVIPPLEGVKETAGKLYYELDWEFITQMAERMAANTKYTKYNWMLPLDVAELQQAMFRHMLEIMKGNYADDGRPFGHLEALATNAMMVNHQLKQKDVSRDHSQTKTI